MTNAKDLERDIKALENDPSCENREETLKKCLKLVNAWVQLKYGLVSTSERAVDAYGFGGCMISVDEVLDRIDELENGVFSDDTDI